MLVDVGSEIVNLEGVRKIRDGGRCPASGLKRVELVYGDGSKIVSHGLLERFAQLCGVTVPAPVGHKVIWAHRSVGAHKGWWFSTWPVVAFQVSNTGSEPITVRGFCRGDDWGLVLPDGRVDVPSYRVFDTVDQFRDYYLSGEHDQETDALPKEMAP